MSRVFDRAERLLGKEAMKRLASSRVAVFGLGGVGGHAAEALARCGVGAFDLVDDDKICLTNINRQIVADTKTVGRFKTEVMGERIAAINPKASVTLHTCFFTPQNAGDFDFSLYDYVVDAVDTVSAKLVLVERAKAAGVLVISCMGAGNKLDPTRFEVADIYKTSVCPLARVMRRELKARGIDSLKVVYSKEPAIKPGRDEGAGGETTCASPPGSVSFVPPVAGLIIAGEVVKDLTGINP